jgi:hypothetical protein
MITTMKYILGSLVFLVVGISPVSAYELAITEVERPYDVVAVEEDEGVGHAFLGELKDFPVMYEVNTDESITFMAQVRQPYSQATDLVPFSLIVIRQNDDGRGVTEVVRQRPSADDWTVVEDSVFGMTFWESEKLSATIGPGIYRIEISTPENQGRYMLMIGESEQSSGYFETLANVRMTQNFFGVSIFKMLTSSYVYYPIGIFLLLFVIHRTWKYRNSITRVE